LLRIVKTKENSLEIKCGDIPMNPKDSKDIEPATQNK
jgi:hypothetical protein